MDKPSLVRINNDRDDRFKPIYHSFGEEFHGAVLQGNRPKSVRGTGTLLLEEENQMRSVEPIQQQGSRVKFNKKIKDVRLDRRPKILIKGGAKPVRARTCIHVHGEERLRDLFLGEWHREVEWCNVQMRVNIE